MITRDNLKALISYNPKSKVLSWKPRGIEYFSNAKNKAEGTMKTWNARYAGRPIHIDRWHRVCIFRKRVKVSEVIALLGYKVCNSVLRREQQIKMQLRTPEAIRCDDTPGVYWNPQRNKFRAQIYINGRVNHLGSHKTLEAAKAARRAAEQMAFQ